MKTTIRSVTFETNSSSSHIFVHMSKKTFESWMKAENVLIRDGYAGACTEKDLEDLEKSAESEDGTHGLCPCLFREMNAGVTDNGRIVTIEIWWPKDR